MNKFIFINVLLLFIKTRDRVKLAEQESAEKKRALEQVNLNYVNSLIRIHVTWLINYLMVIIIQVEKLVKNITVEILEYLPIVTAYDSSNSEEVKSLNLKIFY